MNLFRPPPPMFGLATLVATALLCGPSPSVGQAPEWNEPRTLELVRRALEVRRSLVVDSLLQSYRSDARGFVYFFLDRNDSDERTLVKTDQVALEVFWRAPDETRQRIVGLRDRKALPTNIQYHLDHLTVVQDEFGDRIRLGDGDEVESVPHPIATDGEAVYDYRLADSLTLEFGGGREPVRVYEVEVRPKNPDRPGFVGAVYLDRASAAIVRMTFTFTPASYVDPYLDYIRISLDNGLWMQRFWLPYRQEVELRRELPQLDFLAGSVIRGRFEIRDYRFNETLPDLLFAGRTVLAVPEAQRRAFPFEESIYAELESEGLESSVAMEEVTAQARQIVRDRALSGLAPLRLHWNSVSDAVRHNRAEGLYLGVGTTVRSPLETMLRLHGGWSFGREDPTARAELTPRGGDPATRLVAEWRAPRDIGPFSPGNRLFSSLASLAGEDWTDLYLVSGVSVEHRLGPAEGRHLRLGAGWEDHRSAGLTIEPGTDLRRPVLPVHEGGVARLDAALAWPRAVGEVDLTLVGGVAHLDDRVWGTTSIGATYARTDSWQTWSMRLGARAGATLGRERPPQALFLLGGRGSLPGHAHRDFVGDRYWLIEGQVGRPVHAPWVGVHLLAAAGESWMSGDAGLPPNWSGRTDAGIRGSAGVGLDLFWNVVSLDVVRGLGPDGEWTLLVGVSPRFHPWL
ncbi:hypothetical protein [Gaopeijia maritima]|uniref:Bacterial surface antigen (D15) domain-containing protein n=1 Tax=Gaopeijia maritima TaxID=3119007 RepID=A0ABU9E5B3_9BACT